MSYTSRVPAGGNGLAQIVRAEWTKLRTIRSTVLCLVLVVGLTTLMAVLGASGSKTNANEAGEMPVFAVQFGHRELAGDGEVVARVVSQERTGPDAKAGLMITSVGSDGFPVFAAIMVTPDHGVQWLDGFTEPTQGSDSAAPRWLKLRRAGNVVEGFESADGRSWTPVGRAELAGLASTADAGLFATSPSTTQKCVRSGGGSTSCRLEFEASTAVFDSVALTRADGRAVSGPWQSGDATGPEQKLPGPDVPGSFTEEDGRFIVSGAGDLGVLTPSGDNDLVRDSLAGILVGFIAIAVMSILFMTGEHRRGLVRTTFAASPRRGQVLTAKVAVVGSVAFVVGVVAAVAALVASRPILRENGFGPPAYPTQSLTDGPVVRAVLGTGLILALFAVLALALGTVLRRSAPTITLVVGLVLLPFFVGPFLSLDGEKWLQRLTPAAGLAIQQTRPRFDAYIDPWLGTAVLGGYVAVALGLAYWLLSRRDV